MWFYEQGFCWPSWAPLKQLDPRKLSSFSMSEVYQDLNLRILGIPCGQRSVALPGPAAPTQPEAKLGPDTAFETCGGQIDYRGYSAEVKLQPQWVEDLLWPNQKWSFKDKPRRLGWVLSCSHLFKLTRQLRLFHSLRDKLEFKSMCEEIFSSLIFGVFLFVYL